MSARMLFITICCVWICIGNAVANTTSENSCDFNEASNTSSINVRLGSQRTPSVFGKEGIVVHCDLLNSSNSAQRVGRVELREDIFVQVLLDWIAKNSAYSTDKVPVPPVVIMPARDITTEYYRDHIESIPEGGVDNRILAFYDALAGEHGAIYLRTVEPGSQGYSMQRDHLNNHMLMQTAFSVDRKRHTGSQGGFFEGNTILTERLIHELVHHVQHHTGVMDTFPCSAHGEKEAYRVGGLYFKQLGIDDPMDNRNFWADLYSLC